MPGSCIKLLVVYSHSARYWKGAENTNLFLDSMKPWAIVSSSALAHVRGGSSGGSWCARMKTDTPQITAMKKANPWSRDRANLAPALSGPMATGER